MQSGVNMDRKKRTKYLLLFTTTGFFCVLLAVILSVFHPDYLLTDEKTVLYTDADSAVMSTSLNRGAVTIAPPAFDHDNGFYDDGFYLQLSAPENCTIYYTTDSSVPSDQSSVYSEPIYVRDVSPDQNVSHELANLSETEPVNKASIIRAVAYDSKGNQSEIVTKAYFIDYSSKQYQANLPTVSLVSDPINLFDPTRGIYVNYEMVDWEREALFAYYDANGNYVFEQNLGIRLRGTSTRSSPLKDFTLLARSEFDGNDEIQYPLFTTPMDSLVLRHRELPQKEGFLSSLVADRDLTTQEYQMVNLYINGEFWGVYALLGRVDEYSLSKEYGIDEDNIAYIKINHFAEGSKQAMQYYRALVEFLNTADMSIPENYQKACEQIDMQSMIDFYCTNIYLNNIDSNCFSINSLMWRSVDVKNDGYEDGKWRFGLYDLDHAVSTDGFELIDDPRITNLTNSYEFNYFTEFFPYGAVGPVEDSVLNNFMANTEFRKQFYDTFLEIAQNNFSPERVLPLLEQLPYQEGNDQLAAFFANRPHYIFDYLDDYVHNGSAYYKQVQAEEKEAENDEPALLRHGATAPLALTAFVVLSAVLTTAYIRRNGGLRRGKGG